MLPKHKLFAFYNQTAAWKFKWPQGRGWGESFHTKDQLMQKASSTMSSSIRRNGRLHIIRSWYLALKMFSEKTFALCNNGSNGCHSSCRVQASAHQLSANELALRGNHAVPSLYYNQLSIRIMTIGSSTWHASCYWNWIQKKIWEKFCQKKFVIFLTILY